MGTTRPVHGAAVTGFGFKGEKNYIYMYKTKLQETAETNYKTI